MKKVYLYVVNGLISILALFLISKVVNFELNRTYVWLSVIISLLGLSFTNKLENSKKYIIVQILVSVLLTMLIYFLLDKFKI